MKSFGRTWQRVWMLALALPAAAVAANWIEKSPVNSPPDRSHPAGAQIAPDQVLVFGGAFGVSGDYYGDTWIYDLSDDDWTNVSPADDADGNPAPRVTHGLAPIGTGKALLYGGYVDAGVDIEPSDAAWLYDHATNSWTPLAPVGPTPGPRANVEIARIGENKVVLFGGTTWPAPGEVLAKNDTWVYDLVTNEWTEMQPQANGPVPADRYFHTLAQLADDKVILFGGISCDPAPCDGDPGNQQYADPSTWVYDLSDDTWTEFAPGGDPTPEPGNSHGMVWLGGDRALLFGGFSFVSFDQLGETWIFDLSEGGWSQQAPADAPLPREYFAAGGLDGGKVLIFGGWACVTPTCDTNERSGETWIWDAEASGAGAAALGMKYYDANANGQHDDGEVGIEGWPIDVTGSLGTTTVATDVDGLFEVALDADTYTVAEQLSANLAWHQTGNLVDQSNTAGVTLEDDGSYTVVAVDGDYPGLNFGNLCLGAGGAPPGGAYGLGYWTNKNGVKLVGAGDLAMLVALHLKGQSGADFDPATFTALKTWLSKAKSTNMAYMLSAQLSALALSVYNGFVDDALLVWAPGATSSNAAGFAAVADLVAEADAALAADGQTPAGDPNRAYQEGLKDALEGANKNLTFVQDGPESCPAPF